MQQNIASHDVFFLIFVLCFTLFVRAPGESRTQRRERERELRRRLKQQLLTLQQQTSGGVKLDAITTRLQSSGGGDSGASTTTNSNAASSIDQAAVRSGAASDATSNVGGDGSALTRQAISEANRLYTTGIRSTRRNADDEAVGVCSVVTRFNVVHFCSRRCFYLCSVFIVSVQCRVMFA